jgi:hypothetical protein
VPSRRSSVFSAIRTVIPSNLVPLHHSRRVLADLVSDVLILVNAILFVILIAEYPDGNKTIQGINTFFLVFFLVEAVSINKLMLAVSLLVGY